MTDIILKPSEANPTDIRLEGDYVSVDSPTDIILRESETSPTDVKLRTPRLTTEELPPVNIIDLWLMNSVSSDEGGTFVANEIDGGANLYISGDYSLVGGVDGSAVYLYNDAYLHSDATTPIEFTVEWIAKFVSDDWWGDDIWHAFAVRKDNARVEFLVDSTSVEEISSIDFDNDFSLFFGSTSATFDTIRVSNRWRINSELLTISITETTSYNDYDYYIGIFALSYEDYDVFIRVSTLEHNDYNFYIPSLIMEFNDYNLLIMALNDETIDGNYYLTCMADESEDTNYIVNIAGNIAAEDYGYLIQACFDAFEDYDYKINCFADETVDGEFHIPILALNYEDNNLYINTTDVGFIDASYITRVYEEYGYEEYFFEIQISDYCDASFFIPTPEYLDSNTIIYIADYDDYYIWLMVPDYIDSSFFIPTPGYLDYGFSIYVSDYLDSTTYINISTVEYIDTSFYLSTDSFKDYEILIFVPDHEDYVVQVNMADYNDYNMYVSVLDEDTEDAIMFIPTPGYLDASMFIPTPNYDDYNFLVDISDYVDGNWYIPTRAIGFCDASIVSKHIVLSYCDTGGIEEGIFINIETYFGFADGVTRIGIVTDNLLDVAHVLVSSLIGEGQKSPVMLLERGPYFGVTNTYGIMHYNWSRCIWRLYGYNSPTDALAAVDTHISNGAILTKMIWDPIEAGQWYIIRWKDTIDGDFNYSYFRGVENVNTRMNVLTQAGKYEVESHIWETLMTYFQVFTVQAAYPEISHGIFGSHLEMTEEDLVVFNQVNTGYIWETDVSDYNDDTWWQTEDGAIVPHWIRVIF